MLSAPDQTGAVGVMLREVGDGDGDLERLTELRPRLIGVSAPSTPEGAVIVLHGGASRRDRMRVNPAQLSVVRMIPIAYGIARSGRGKLAVFRLLNSRRGWDTTHTPAQDARWAIAQVRDRLGGALPICLVGHSLGGRAALLAAGEPEVAGSVALAPWVLASDAPQGIDGKRILIVHGSRDRVADPARSEALAERLRSARVSYVVVDGAKHAMLRHHSEFSRRAAEFAVAILLGERLLI
jgi:pimeloyl-ACP methyl ester carboxylesterase